MPFIPIDDEDVSRCQWPDRENKSRFQISALIEYVYTFNGSLLKYVEFLVSLSIHSLQIDKLPYFSGLRVTTLQIT
jgi:hypothetical protein